MTARIIHFEKLIFSRLEHIHSDFSAYHSLFYPLLSADRQLTAALLPSHSVNKCITPFNKLRQKKDYNTL